MEEISFEDPREQYNTLKARVESVEWYLKLLYSDYRLMTEQNFKLTFAVDFHEIYQYADPVAQFLWAERKEPSAPRKSVLENQVARAGLFYGLRSIGSPVLLPPYVVELNNHIAWLRVGVMKAVVSTYTLIEWPQELDRIVDNEIVREALGQFEQSGQVDSELVRQLREFLEKKLGDVLFLISGVAGQGLDVIRDLLYGDEPRVQMTSSRWPALRTLIQQAMEAPDSEWYRRFHKMRSSPKSMTSNLNDAKAIDLVLALNQHLVPDRELVLLVSDAHMMKRVLQERPDNGFGETSENYIWADDGGASLEVPGVQEPVPIFRPLLAFYYLLLFQADSDAGILENLREELDRIDQVHVLGKSVEELPAECSECTSEEQREACEVSDVCARIRQELSEHSEHFDMLSTVRLAVNRFPVIEPYWERVKKQQDVFEKRLAERPIRLISYLSERRGELETSLKERERQLLNLLESDLAEALSLATDVSSSYRKELGESLERFTRTRYRVHFRSEKVTSLLEEMEEARYTGDQAATCSLIKQLVRFAFQEEIGPDRLLLWAVLLIHHRLYRRAGDLATRVLDRPYDERYIESRPEYLYLRGLALYEGGEYAQAIRACESSIEEYRNDPRFYHLCGLAILTWREENPKKCSYSWDDALTYVGQAYDLTAGEGGDEELHISVTNNRAYLLYLKKDSKDIEDALGYVEEFWGAGRSVQENPAFLHTRGCVLWWAALLATEHEVQQKRALESLGNLTKACERAEATGVAQRELRLCETALREAKQELASILSPNTPLERSSDTSAT